jgi:hypothetical protein
MVTVYLNRSSKQFWRMTPRETIALIRQYKKIEQYRMQLNNYIRNGGNPDEIETQEVTKEKARAMGEAMW